MHDPLTQAFVIPYGWRNETFANGTKWRYWKPLITIWHKDPERGGSDDSCRLVKAATEAVDARDGEVVGS